jgi:hypothetical protein
MEPRTCLKYSDFSFAVELKVNKQGCNDILFFNESNEGQHFYREGVSNFSFRILKSQIPATSVWQG